MPAVKDPPVAAPAQPKHAPLPPAKLPVMEWLGSEREGRRHIRVRSNMPVNVKYGGIYEVLGQAINLSARGMFFEVGQKLNPGTTIQLVFRLPRAVIRSEGIWLRCQAKVLRVEEEMPGGKFAVAARITSYDLFRV
jgi:hypothetical protein